MSDPKSKSQAKSKKRRNVQVMCSQQSAMPSVKSAESETLPGIIRSDSMTNGSSLRSCLLLVTVLGLLCGSEGESGPRSPSITGIRRENSFYSLIKSVLHKLRQAHRSEFL